jgi:hypothetical protein
MSESMVVKVVEHIKDNSQMEWFTFHKQDAHPYSGEVTFKVERPYTDTKGESYLYEAWINDSSVHGVIKSITVYHNEFCYSKYRHSKRSNIKKSETVIELLCEGYKNFVTNIECSIRAANSKIIMKNTVSTELPMAKKLSHVEEWAIVDSDSNKFSGLCVKKYNDGYSISKVLGKLSADQVKAIFEIARGAEKAYDYLSFEKESVDNN